MTFISTFSNDKRQRRYLIGRGNCKTPGARKIDDFQPVCLGRRPFTLWPSTYLSKVGLGHKAAKWLKRAILLVPRVLQLPRHSKNALYPRQSSFYKCIDQTGDLSSIHSVRKQVLENILTWVLGSFPSASREIFDEILHFFVKSIAEGAMDE